MPFFYPSQFLFLFLLPILIPGTAATFLDVCQPTRCRKNGPLIRFPFRRTNSQPQHCGFNQSFNLHCNENRETILQLPFSVNVSITRINYRSQAIQFRDQEKCLDRKLPNLNLSASPFSFSGQLNDYALFNCSTDIPRDSRLHPIHCLGVDGYQVFSFDFDQYTDTFQLTNCTRVLEVRSVPWYVFNRRNMWLSWSEPDCGRCEAADQYCGFNRCFDKPKGTCFDSRWCKLNTTSLVFGSV